MKTDDKTPPFIVDLVADDKMSRRKQARPRLVKRDEEEEADEIGIVDDSPESKKPKLSGQKQKNDIDENAGESWTQLPVPEVFRCETCRATFDNLINFMDHKNLQCDTGACAMKPDGTSRSGTPSSVDSGCSTTGSLEILMETMDPEHVPGHNGVDDDHPHPCQFCDKAFAKVNLLRVHEQVHTDMMPYRCPVCNRLFRHKRSRDRHVKVHSCEKKYKCTVCNQAFVRSEHLNNHMRTHKFGDKFPCSVCSLEFSTMSDLMSHHVVHKEKPSLCSDGNNETVTCHECEEVFLTRNELESHKCSGYDGKKTYHCQHCNAICVGLTALVLHCEHSHSLGGTDKNKCPLCFKCFMSLEELTSHIKIHEKVSADIMIEEPELRIESVFSISDFPQVDYTNTLSSSLCPTDILVCPYCLRDDFETLECLELHMQGVHSVKPAEVYTCNYCNAPYKNLYSLHEHMRAIHQNQPSMGIKYPCSRCGKEYPSIEALQDHKKRMHHYKQKRSDGGLYPCPHCPLNFVSSVSLKDHFLTSHREDATFSNDKQNKSATSAANKSVKITSMKAKESQNSRNDSPTIINVPEPSNLLRHLKSPLRSPGSFQLSPIPPNISISQAESQLQTLITSPPSRGEIDQEKITCEQCGSKFSDVSSYQSHVKLHSDPLLGQYFCRQCAKLFLTEDQLESHMSGHYLSCLSEYGCTACTKVFHKPDELQKHLMDIHAHHLYRCALCKEVFDSKVNIQVHFAIKHSNESKTYKCVTCDVTYRTESEWQVHLRLSHLNVTKPYRCLFCKESFGSEMDLQCHLATHNKPFKCSMCDESFLVEFLLDKHLQNVHSSGVGNSSASSTRTAPETAENGSATMNIKIEKDVDAMKKELPGAAQHASKLFNLLGMSATQNDMLLSNNCDLGMLYPNLGVTVSSSSGGSMVWRSPDDLHRCNICDMKFSQLSGLQTHKLQEHGVKYSPVKSSSYSQSPSPKQSTSDTMAGLFTSLITSAGQDLATLSSEKTSSLLQDALKSSMTSMTLPLHLPDAQSANIAFTEKLVSTLGEKMCLACPFCSQTFKCKADLEKHSKIHLNTGSQKCNICDEVFNSSGVLAEHKLTHCKIQQGNICVVCKIPIKSEDQFYLHSQEHGFQGAVMQCIVCRQTLASMLELQMHGRHHFQNKATFHTCCVCLKSFDSNENLISKLNSSGRTYYVCKPCYQGEIKEFPCNQCGIAFDTASALHSHVLTHKKSYQCIKCQESFSSEQEIQLHVASHMMKEGNIHECKLCFLIFDSPAKLQSHLIEHTYHGSEYKCSVCGRCFNTALDIQSHALEHGIAARRYACNQCNQRFFFSAELENHIYMHNSSSAEQIYDNQLKAKSPNSLVIQPLGSHVFDDSLSGGSMETSVENDLRCAKCDKTFSTVFELTNHYKKHHAQSQEKVIQCSHCTETFSNLTLLQAHFFSVHTTSEMKFLKSRPTCMECGEECASESVLLTHLNNHKKGSSSKVSCSTCVKVFSTSGQLAAHMKSGCGQKLYECSVCNKRFSRKSAKQEHMRTHANGKVFPCSYCGLFFSTKANVQEHLKIHKIGSLTSSEDGSQTDTICGTSEGTRDVSGSPGSEEELSDPERDLVSSTSNLVEETNTTQE